MPMDNEKFAEAIHKAKTNLEETICEELLMVLKRCGIQVSDRTRDQLAGIVIVRITI